MKKALIVLLILGLAGGLFAQSFTGSVSTGMDIDFGTDDFPVIGWGDSDPVKASLSFKNGGDDWGFTVSATAKAASDNNVTGLTIDAFNGWVTFAEMFKLTAGKGQGGNWQATTALFDDGPGGSNAGARLNITPAAVPGLDFGFVFGFPNKGVKAGKIANFFLETGIGAKYSGDLFTAGTALKLFSEETGEVAETDANWWFDAKIPVSIVTVHLDGFIKNLLEKKADRDVQTGVRVEGSVAALDWGIESKQNFNDPLGVTAGADVSYGIPINDKASAEVGADAGVTIVKEFNFDSWGAYAKVSYAFNGNVSSWAKFGIDGDGKFETITPNLKLFVKYSW
jgi:hypothetical protein